MREVSKTTNEIIRESLLPIYHANSLSYNASKNELYLTTVQKVNSQGTALESFNRIIVLDYATWNIKDTITPPQEILDYNEDIMGVSYDNTNDVLALITYTKCFIMEDWETIERTIDLSQSLTTPLRNPENNNKNTAQSGKVHGNKIYLSKYFGNGILVFDLNGNLLQNYYKLDVDIPLNVGEFEDIAIEDDGTLYITSCQRSFIPNHNFDLYDNTIFKTNVKVNGYKLYYNKQQETSNTHIDYFVDCNTNNKLQIGTEQYPFKHIQQAINSANLSQVDTHIYCTTQGNYEYIISNSNTNIYVDGRNLATFYGGFIDRQKMTLYRCAFDLTNDIVVDSPANAKNLLVQYSNIEISDCNFNSISKIDYAINNFHTKEQINACTFNNFTDIFYNRNLTELYISSLTATNCDYYYYFTGFNVLFHYTDNLEFIDPSGSYPQFFGRSQAIKFTVDSVNNKIIFNDYVKRNYLPFKLLYLTVGPVDNTTSLGNFIFTFRYTTNNRLYGSCIKNGYIYHVYLELTTNDTGISYNIYMFKENISTHEKTDVSSTASMNFYSLFFVN